MFDHAAFYLQVKTVRMQQQVNAEGLQRLCAAVYRREGAAARRVEAESRAGFLRREASAAGLA